MWIVFWTGDHWTMDGWGLYGDERAAREEFERRKPMVRAGVCGIAFANEIIRYSVPADQLEIPTGDD